jgi:hypothetical protein
MPVIQNQNNQSELQDDGAKWTETRGVPPNKASWRRQPFGYPHLRFRGWSRTGQNNFTFVKVRFHYCD